MQQTSRSVLSSAAVLLAAATAQAATVYWTGDQSAVWDTVNAGNSNWSTTANGLNDYGKAPGSVLNATSPGASDDLNFSASGATNLTTTIMTPAGGSIYVNSIRMLNGSSPVTIAGANTNQFLKLGAGGLVVENGAGQLTLSARTPLDVAQDWYNNSANPIVIAGLLEGQKVTLKSGVILAGANAGIRNTIGVTTGTTFRVNSTGTVGLTLMTLSLEGGTFDANGRETMVGFLAGSGGTFLNPQANGSLTLDLGQDKTATFSGSIPNTYRNLILRGHGGVGTGTQVLTGVNSYWGATQIVTISGDKGTLQLAGGDNRLPTGKALYMGISGASAATAPKLILGDANGRSNQTFGGLMSYAGYAAPIVGGSSAISTLTISNADLASSTFYGTIGGSGTNENNIALTKSVGGTLSLAGINTYAGDTTVSGGTLILLDNAGLRFVIGANGVNNRIAGDGVGTDTVQLDGDFTFDLTAAGQTVGNSWNIVDVGTLAETFGSTFTVKNFTKIDNVWTKEIDASKKYVFRESDGMLRVEAIPEPASAGLATAVLGLLLARRRRAS